MRKKIFCFVICMLLITIAVFSITSSSSDKIKTTACEPCQFSRGSYVSEDPVEAVYDKTLRDIPDSWDWRNLNGNDWTTPIKDQDQDKCGSCWAFGALGGLESVIKIIKNDPNLDVDLSEQYMLSCSPGSCNGWFIDRTVRWIKTNGSIPESCFPYEADDTIPCEDKCSNWREQLVGVDGYLKIAINISVIESALIEFGPLPATMDVYSDFYPNFEGGIYHHTNGTYVFGHVVTIVGYNNTDSYWICKNSWGNAWGEEGWFRIAFDECKIERGVYCYNGLNYVVVKPDKPKTNAIPISGKTFTAVAFDPDNDSMKYCFDWDDGTYDWIDLNASGVTVSINHSWSAKGVYNVRVKVQDEHGLESDWSDPLQIKLSKNISKPEFIRLLLLLRFLLG